MEDKILNEKESLELISKMIQNTQNKLESGKGKPFLIFGYIAFIVSIAVYALLKTTNNQYPITNIQRIAGITKQVLKDSRW